MPLRKEAIMDYVIWFNDGHRETLGREDLAKYFLDEDGGVVGGIFKEAKNG